MRATKEMPKNESNDREREKEVGKNIIEIGSEIRVENA